MLCILHLQLNSGTDPCTVIVSQNNKHAWLSTLYLYYSTCIYRYICGLTKQYFPVALFAFLGNSLSGKNLCAICYDILHR
jgi:hypothetical protein